MKPNYFLLFLLTIIIASCSSLDLKEYDNEISSDELFASDRLSYRYKNEILVKEFQKKNDIEEKQE